jgi:tetratricopeptide (TPR) repeat protein
MRLRLGSWDVTPFGNDEAQDWLSDLILSHSTEPIFRALVTAAKVSAEEFLQAPESERAVAAAELVACAREKPCKDVPEQLAAWVAEQKFVAGDQIAQMAVQVLERIASNSELQQVWDDTDSAEEWHDRIRDLQGRLRQSHQPAETDSLPEAPPSAEQMCEQAAVLIAQHQYAAALEKYAQAAEQSPSSQMVYMGRAICHLWMGTYDKVIDDINMALSLGKPIPDAYQLRSQAFFHQKKYKNVVADLTSYLRVRPKHMESYYIRGLAYANLQQFANAIADFTVAIDNNSLDYLYDALTNRASCFEQIGRPDLAAWDRQHLAQLAAAAAIYRPS